jgi:hypothetical protein
VLLVRVYHREDYSSLTAVSQTVESIRAAVRDVRKGVSGVHRGRHRPAGAGADEMRTTDRDSHRAEASRCASCSSGSRRCSLVWLALAGEIALGVGIGWTFGWATLPSAS